MVKRGIISLIVILFLFFLVPTVLAQDVLVWQGQYYTGTTFNTGTYEFNFSVYDALIGGGGVLLQHNNFNNRQFWRMENRTIRSKLSL